MKKRILQSLFIAASLVACRQDDDDTILGKPEVRMDQLVKDYHQKLVSSPNGWKGYVFPGNGGGYSFLMQFSSEGRVVMMADINEESATKSFESSFRLATVQRPSLFFDTYSYLHILSDPDPNVIGGVVGEGLKSDFEFAFEKVSDNGDTIHLKGNQNASSFTLIKATSEEAVAYRRGDIKTLMNKADAYGEAHQFVYIQSPDGKRLNTTINLDKRSFSLSLRQADTLNIQSVPFSYTSQGLHLKKPVRYGNITFQDVLFDGATEQYYAMSNGSRINLVTSEEPILPLHLLLDVDFNTISAPQAPLEGSSPNFNAIVEYMTNALENAGLTYLAIELEFHTDNKTMNMNLFFEPFDASATYVAQYPFTYEKSTDGVFKFKQHDEPNGNGKFLLGIMPRMFYYFDNNRFRMDYYKSENGYIPQMRSVESPQFYFTGNFGSEFF